MVLGLDARLRMSGGGVDVLYLPCGEGLLCACGLVDAAAKRISST